ncbi:MAG TPA: hypothetical protein VMZ03_08480 [Chitinophagaceae bacterium]|nr:hypothetical protein [Chitinophagaceae bacterium]
MKKTLLLIAMVTLVSTTLVSSASSTAIYNASSISKAPPEEVAATFNGIMTNIMEVAFPGNSSYDASAVNWTKNKNVWTCEGYVTQANGNGTVQVVSGSFVGNNGQMIEFFYNVNP